MPAPAVDEAPSVPGTGRSDAEVVRPRPCPGSATTTSMPSGSARVRITARVCGCSSASTRRRSPSTCRRDGHGHRLGRGGGLVEQRGVGEVEAGQVHHHLLEVQQRLQPALADLGLVGRVGGVPARVLQHVALDHRRRDRCRGSPCRSARSRWRLPAAKARQPASASRLGAGGGSVSGRALRIAAGTGRGRSPRPSEPTPTAPASPLARPRRGRCGGGRSRRAAAASSRGRGDQASSVLGSEGAVGGLVHQRRRSSGRRRSSLKNQAAPSGSRVDLRRVVDDRRR